MHHLANRSCRILNVLYKRRNQYFNEIKTEKIRFKYLWRCSDEQEGQRGGYHLTLISQLESCIGRNVLQVGDSNEQLVQHRIGQRPDCAQVDLLRQDGLPDFLQIAQLVKALADGVLS